MLPSKHDVLSVYNKVSSRVKQYALSLTPLELKVDEATNHEPWGPHGTVMAEISRAAFDYEDYKQIMGVIARRLQSEGENWRHVYKSLLLLEYMSKHGPQKVADELGSNIGAIERLQRFEHKDKNGKDWGLNVRQRAKELANLVTNPDRVRSERQKAKQNESKYTGVSAEASRMDSRMGGFGSSSSSFSPAGGSALSSLAGGAKGYGSSSGAGTGFGSGGGFNSNSRYDDDYEAGHSALKTDDPDEEDSDAKEATRRRIEAMRKAGGEPVEGRGSPLKGSRAQAVAAEQESRGPKKLSQVRVNPNIASSLKGGVSPSPGSKPPQQATAAPILDLFASDAPQATEAAPQAPSAADLGSAWNAFGDMGAGPSSQKQPQQPSDDWAGLLDGGGSGVQPPIAPDDPFAALAAPQSQQNTQAAGSTAASSSPSGTSASLPADPFASFGSGQRIAKGPMPIAPAPQKANQDPFARLTTADPFAPAVKPHSPLKAASGNTPKAGDPFASDPFGNPQFTAAPAAAPKPGSSSRVGQALPEDMFSSPTGFQVRVGTTPQSSGGPAAFSSGYAGSPSRFAPPAGPSLRPQAGAPSAFPQPSNSSFADFAAASPSGGRPNTEDMFGNMSLASTASSGQAPDALGGGFKMAPNVPQPNLPPPVVKQDPFAGLAGF